MAGVAAPGGERARDLISNSDVDFSGSANKRGREKHVDGFRIVVKV